MGERRLSDTWKHPLEDLKVLDVSQRVAGGYAARLFAQLGARVTRIVTDQNGHVPDEVSRASAPLQSRMSEYVHAGKSPEPPAPSNAELLSSTTEYNVLVHDRGPEFAEAVLSVAGPELRVVSLSPFGWTGPYKDWKADSLTLQALSGISALVGDPRREPVMLPGFSIQYAAGSFAFIAGMSMLLGRGFEDRHVHVTELEAASTLHQTTYLAYTRLGWVRKRSQFMLPTATYFSCTDGEIIIAAVRPNHWEGLAMACEQPELVAEKDYRTFLDRRLYASELEPKLAPWFATRGCEEAFQSLCRAGVPAAIVKTPAEATRDPQFAHRQFIQVDEKGESSLPLPFLLNGQRPGVRS